MSKKTYSLVVRTNAELDIFEKIKFWEGKREGLGTEFLDAVEQAINSIQSNPQMFQIKYRDLRVAYTKPFSYGVHYNIEGDIIYVHAVMHTSMRPPA